MANSVNPVATRSNRGTLYALSVFDLDAGPVTVTPPDAGRRFMSMQVIDEDHCTPKVIYRAGTCAFARDGIAFERQSPILRLLLLVSRQGMHPAI